MLRNVLRASGSVKLAPGTLQIGLLFIIIVVIFGLMFLQLSFSYRSVPCTSARPLPAMSPAVYYVYLII